MFNHLTEFARRVKLSGTPEELESFRYLQHTLDGYGYRTTLLQHDAYISLPGKARVDVEAEHPRCITHSFSQASPPSGTSARLVHVGVGSEQDFAKNDLRGCIALIEGVATPATSLRASNAGAVGQLHISPHEHLHEMCISPVWGSPTHRTVTQLPQTVVITIPKEPGDRIKTRVLRGEQVMATLHAEVDTGWRKTPLLVAELDAPHPSDDAFVMFSGHHDTWYYGVMDNGGANATMLEVARIACSRRSEWRRGLRLCFWSGHSHGRYSGSAWYADHHWQELSRRCAVHVNVDSTGAKGNTVLADMSASAELLALAREVIREQGQQELTGSRLSRAGDQSFWGIGIPSLFMTVGEQPAGAGENVMGFLFSGSGRKGSGFGWWWHTPDDTLDKMDPDLLVRDTRIYVHAIWRLLSDSVLPLDYESYGKSLVSELRALNCPVGAHLDLDQLVARAEHFTRLAGGFSQRVASAVDGEASQLNGTLMALSRQLVPIDYTSGDRFGQDAALGQSAYPVLDPVRLLAGAPLESDKVPFLRVAAVRARNRVADAVEQAIEILEDIVTS
jgi:hypothetical protein